MGLDSPEAAAAGIVDIVNENMLGGLRLVSVQQGFDPRDFALVAFGGAGPLHANALGMLTGAWPVIVPPSPGVLCALGDATTSLRDESARTVLRRFADLTGDELGRPARRARRRRRPAAGRAGARRATSRPWLPGRRPLPRPGLRDPGRRRPAGSTTRTAPSAGWRRPSTPSTSGCSPSCSTSTTSWSTPARPSPARGPTSPRSPLEEGDGDPSRAWHRAPDLRRRRHGRRRRLRPRQAPRRRRRRRPRDGHRDGLHDPRPARPRGGRARRRAAC